MKPYSQLSAKENEYLKERESIAKLRDIFDIIQEWCPVGEDGSAKYVGPFVNFWIAFQIWVIKQINYTLSKLEGKHLDNSIYKLLLQEDMSFLVDIMDEMSHKDTWPNECDLIEEKMSQTRNRKRQYFESLRQKW